MKVETFKPFTAEELINQLNTGITYISRSFSVEEPTKDIVCGAIDSVLSFFKGSDIKITVKELNGYTTLSALKVVNNQ